MSERRAFNFNEYQPAQQTAFESNRILFDWLCDDADRRALYDALAGQQHALVFASRAHVEDDPAPPLGTQRPAGHSLVALITERADIEQVLRDTQAFSNIPYSVLGTGSFMLALAPGDAHAAQRQALIAALPGPADGLLIDKLAAQAMQQAAAAFLGARQFDLAVLAEAAALRLCSLLFGYAARDMPALEDALRKVYRALNYQMLGRHFVSEPLAIPAAKEAMARLLARSAELINDYQHLVRYPVLPSGPFDPRRERDALPKGVQPLSQLGLSGLTPVMQRLGSQHSALSGDEMAVVVVGAMAGIMGNIQASVCITVDHVFNHDASTWSSFAGLDEAKREQFVDAAMRAALSRNPPAAFLPRRAVLRTRLPSGRVVNAGQECILAMGAGTRASPGVCPYQPKQWPEDPLVFGGQDIGAAHWCLGNHLARALVRRVVGDVLRLPGLAQLLDPQTGEPKRLEKRWGFGCERYRLQYKREKRLAQQPLNVVMRIKSPVAENAARLRRIIQDGAPRITQALNEARHVHFAWFELLEGDTKLALHTVYDGDFDAYVMHFALKVDDLFDLLFESIDGAPRLPVADYPNDFVNTIRQYNQAPVAGYFYSAYPLGEVPDLCRAVRQEQGS